MKHSDRARSVCQCNVNVWTVGLCKSWRRMLVDVTATFLLNISTRETRVGNAPVRQLFLRIGKRMGPTASLEGLEKRNISYFWRGKNSRMNKRQCRHAKHFQDGEKQCCEQRDRMNGLDAERKGHRHRNWELAAKGTNLISTLLTRDKVQTDRYNRHGVRRPQSGEPQICALKRTSTIYSEHDLWKWKWTV